MTILIIKKVIGPTAICKINPVVKPFINIPGKLFCLLISYSLRFSFLLNHSLSLFENLYKFSSFFHFFHKAVLPVIMTVFANSISLFIETFNNRIRIDFKIKINSKYSVNILNSQRATEAPAGIIRFCTIMVNKDSVIATVTIDGTTKFSYFFRRFYPA